MQTELDNKVYSAPVDYQAHSALIALNGHSAFEASQCSLLALSVTGGVLCNLTAYAKDTVTYVHA